MHEKVQSNKDVINTDLSNTTFKELNKALDFKLGDAAGIDPKVLEMKKNLYKFACAKSTAQLEELNHWLYDGDKPRSWEDFRAKVVESNTKFNENWLQAEWQTANISGHHARNWQKYQEQKHLFPNLKYRTAGDNRVRKEHDKLDGIIMPIDDKFWNKYYPPNGWRCRCGVTQTAEPISKDVPSTFKEVRPEFEHNVGKGGQVFSEDIKKGHKYFVLAKDVPNWNKRFELAKQEAPYEKVQTPKGNKVEVSIYADPEDYNLNLNMIQITKDSLNLNIKIRPHINIDGEKNAELLDHNNIKGDRISPEWKNIKTATDNAFKLKLSKKKNSQLAKEKNAFITIEVNFEPTNSNIEAFSQQSWSKFKQYENLDYVIYYRENKAVKIGREIISSGYDYYAKEITKVFKSE